MRALVLKDYGQMVVEERPKPTPKPREILLRICATGICGSDLHGYTGESGRRIPGQVMGHESVGTIAALGEAVDEQKFRVGQVATFNPVIVTGPELESFRGREQHAPGKMIVGVAQDLVSSFAEFVAVTERLSNLLRSHCTLFDACVYLAMTSYWSSAVVQSVNPPYSPLAPRELRR
jgi:L-iditol 2-dehydrogenase